MAIQSSTIIWHVVSPPLGTIVYLLCVLIGKMTRGLMVVTTLSQLYDNRPLSTEEKQLAFTLGWCIEIVSMLFVVSYVCTCMKHYQIQLCVHVYIYVYMCVDVV